MLNKLQKQVCRTVCPIPAVSLESLTLTHSWSKSFFYCYFFCRCSSKLGELIPFSAITGWWPIILIICMTFLWPFINDISMSMSYALFTCLPHIFSLTYYLNSLSLAFLSTVYLSALPNQLSQMPSISKFLTKSELTTCKISLRAE